MNKNDEHWMPHVNHTLCTGCGYCVDLCPTNALTQFNDKAHLAHPDQCIYCFACEDVCPEGAIELPLAIVKQKSPQNNERITDYRIEEQD